MEGETKRLRTCRASLGLQTNPNVAGTARSLMPPAGPESEPDPPELGSSPGRRDLSMKAWENLGVEEPHEDVGQAGVIVSVIYISSA